jgi:hypothetical protein
MGAHFAQKIVEIEKEAVSRDTLKSSVGGMDFNHLNDSTLKDSTISQPADHATLTGKYLSAEAQGTTSSMVGQQKEDEATTKQVRL